MRYVLMSKRQKTGGLTRFYEEWHIKRTHTVVQQVAATAQTEEWAIDCPRPEGTASGRYPAIEIHTIEYSLGPIFDPVIAAVAQTEIDWAITTSPRTGKVPFITDCGDPDNLWFHHEEWHSPTEVLSATTVHNEYTRLRNKAVYTDKTGHGKLLVGDHIYIQGSANRSGTALAVKPSIHLAIEFSWTTVGCSEVLGDLTSRLNEA